jgi:outer membrane protein OmpA-like peptidoglycan-associated protein/opacity protein-like surface antigen
MASKKYTLLAGVFCLLITSAFSQIRPYEDSSKIPPKRMPQYTEFMQGTYDFPAKPRNQWEVGVKVGTSNISGDVRSKFVNPGFGVHVRKAFGYLFSARLEYSYQLPKGLNWERSFNYSSNPAWMNNGYNPNAGEPVFYNYKSNIMDLSLQGVFTLNNIRFHKAKTGFNLYVFAGVGAMTYDTKVNALDASGAKYNFSSVNSGTWKTRKDVRDALKNLMDDSYETPAENHGDRRPKLGGNTLKSVWTVGAGIAYKLSNRLNLALEDRFTGTNDDLVDGQQWAEQVPRSPVLTQNFDTYNFLSLGLNINLGAKSVEPLWWENPLSYVYAEVRNPKTMKFPPVVLPDADNDGVTDQFDLEPNTPQGCPVDSHGVSRDSDGDGVPDCKDKELVTPTYCQPVDADGVGKCPVPCPDTSCACCKMGGGPSAGCDVKMGALPSVTFSGRAVTLSKDAQSLLASAASRIRNNPECRVVVVGYCSSTKQEQQLSWDRVNAVINYLVEKEGISQDRFIFQFGQEGGDCNTVDLRAAASGEEGPNTVPPPHPNLRRSR